MVLVTNNRPHIFLLITKGDIGGAQVHVLALIEYLKPYVKFTLGCGEEGFLTEQAKQLGIDVIIIPSLQRKILPIQDYKAYKALCGIIAKLNPDLVHVHSSKAGILGRLSARSAGTPSLFTAHGWAFTEGASKLQQCYGLVAEWIAARIGDGIITVSQYDFNLAKRYRIKSKKGIWLVHNGVKDYQSSRNTAKNDVLQILNIGRISPQKNQKLLIAVAALIKRDFQLVIVGSGELKSELMTTVKKLGLTNKIKFVDNQLNIKPWLTRSHIFALSSNYEGLPLSILEAMSAGLPVVSTNVGGVGEAVLDGVNGFLVARGDHKTMAEKLTRLIDDPKLRQIFSDASIEVYKKSFQINKMCQETLSIYQELVNPSTLMNKAEIE